MVIWPLGFITVFSMIEQLSIEGLVLRKSRALINVFRCFFAEGKIGGLHACGATFSYILPLAFLLLSLLFSKSRLKRKDFQEIAPLAWALSLVFDFVDHNEIFSIRNPLDKVTIPASEEDHPAIRLLSPEEVFALMERVPSPISIAVLLVAATGLRVSEFLALRWRHVLWDESKISIEQVFRRGEILKRTKTKASKAPVPMCQALATTLSEFRQQAEYNKDEDFVFASVTLNGKQPLWGQTMNAQFVKSAAIELGLVTEGERFGWHRFRHSLSTWANDTTKDITVSQTMLRHAKPDITAAIYTHGNFGKALDAQRIYMEQLLRMKPASESAQ